jgi:hypothetical protein
MPNEITYRPQIVAALLQGVKAPIPKYPLVQPSSDDISWKHQHTYTQFAAIVEDIVRRAQADPDDQQYRYDAAFADELIKQLSGHLLEAANSYSKTPHPVVTQK